MHYEIHNKKLPIPSFFQVYNFGGGRGDKDREIVYSEFTKDTPALINYYDVGVKTINKFNPIPYSTLKNSYFVVYRRGLGNI